jgi:VanZ family protein
VTRGGEVSAARTLLSWLPVLSYIGLIWYLSSQTLDVHMESIPFRDKGVHFVEYGALAFMMTHAVCVTWPRARYALTAAFWLTVSAGLMDEFHQAYVPGRTADVYDLLADALGSICAIAFYRLLSALWQRRGAPRPAVIETTHEHTSDRGN